jgi:uncharacterized protein YqjF (DUF2071 family)
MGSVGAPLLLSRQDFPAVLDHTDHRPWVPPTKPWVMTQAWHEMLFVHVPIDVGLIEQRVPCAFEVDTHQGLAWISIVSFRMTHVRLRGLPPVPTTERFPELNVRTYVRVGNKPGVYFFSLDAASALAVWSARRLGLPYFVADMIVSRDGGSITYQSSRRAGPASFAASYRPDGPASHADPGSLDHFLTERYCLYALNPRGRPFRLEIHHRPWTLQPAHARIVRNTMLGPLHLEVPDTQPLLHYAEEQAVLAWGPEWLR